MFYEGRFAVDWFGDFARGGVLAIKAPPVSETQSLPPNCHSQVSSLRTKSLMHREPMGRNREPPVCYDGIAITSSVLSDGGSPSHRRCRN